MNPQMVGKMKSIGVLQANGKSVRRATWIAMVACFLGFASQASRAEDLAVDLVAQLDSVAQYCDDRAGGKDDDPAQAFVAGFLPSASPADLARIRATSDYKRIELWDRSRLAADHKDAPAACAALLNLMPRKFDRPKHEAPRYERPDHN